MALSTEYIITLQQLDGIGNKTILKIANQAIGDITSLIQLCEFWKTLKGKKIESISDDDLEQANRVAHRIMERAEQEGVGIISYYDKIYPEMLRQCTDETGKLDPPILLYYRGDINIINKPSIAVIGTREPTPNGKQAGVYFAAEFAKRGYNIVSGLAIGCDSTGHEGALKVGGVTTAFLANGLDWGSIYPKENLELAKRIVNNGGLLLSEYAIGQACGRYGLVARDRLQAGLSIATMVVQTGIKGGTMHAVHATLASGKPLLVVDYKKAEDLNHEKVQGNIYLAEKKGAIYLSSSVLDFIIDKIEKKRPIVEEKTLFD